MHDINKNKESSIRFIFVRRFIYLTYFDKRMFYSKFKLNNQKKEKNNKDQEQNLSRKDINQIYIFQKQLNAKKIRKNWHINK